MASVTRRIRRNMASERGTHLVFRYDMRDLSAFDRDVALLKIRPAPRGFNTATQREAREFIRVTKARRAAYGR